MSVRTARMTIELPITKHKKFKAAATMMGTTMKRLVLMSIEDFMERRFNKETVKVLRDAEAGKGLKKFKNLQELFDDLGV